ncbi:hypothetical protein GGF50DRAFT_116444 [Schizophyllum commune]
MSVLSRPTDDWQRTVLNGYCVALNVSRSVMFRDIRLLSDSLELKVKRGPKIATSQRPSAPTTLSKPEGFPRCGALSRASSPASAPATLRATSSGRLGVAEELAWPSQASHHSRPLRAAMAAGRDSQVRPVLAASHHEGPQQPPTTTRLPPRHRLSQPAGSALFARAALRMPSFCTPPYAHRLAASSHALALPKRPTAPVAPSPFVLPTAARRACPLLASARGRATTIGEIR